MTVEIPKPGTVQLKLCVNLPSQFFLEILYLAAFSDA